MAVFKGGAQGASMGGMEVGPTRRRRIGKARARQDQRWAAMAGPVTIRFVEPKTKT